MNLLGAEYELRPLTAAEFEECSEIAAGVTLRMRRAIVSRSLVEVRVTVNAKKEQDIYREARQAKHMMEPLEDSEGNPTGNFLIRIPADRYGDLDERYEYFGIVDQSVVRDLHDFWAVNFLAEIQEVIEEARQNRRNLAAPDVPVEPTKQAHSRTGPITGKQELDNPGADLPIMDLG